MMPLLAPLTPTTPQPVPLPRGGIGGWGGVGMEHLLEEHFQHHSPVSPKERWSSAATPPQVYVEHKHNV